VNAEVGGPRRHLEQGSEGSKNTRSCRADTVDYRAYARCVPAAWHRGPAPPGGVRGSARWGDPRAQLPDGERWDQVRSRVPRRCGWPTRPRLNPAPASLPPGLIQACYG